MYIKSWLFSLSTLNNLELQFFLGRQKQLAELGLDLGSDVSSVSDPDGFSVSIDVPAGKFTAKTCYINYCKLFKNAFNMSNFYLFLVSLKITKDLLQTNLTLSYKPMHRIIP